MLALLLWLLSLSPREAVAFVTPVEHERQALLAIGWRESRLRRVARHKADDRPRGWTGVGDTAARRVGSRAWARAVQRGLVRPWCQPLGDARDWSTRGPWGQVAAYAVPYLPACSPPWVLDLPVVSAWAAVQRLRVARGSAAPPALRRWAREEIDTGRIISVDRGPG